MPLSGESIDGFQLKRIRSGAVTLLAAHGASREVRARLQSHGLTDVQARHYDGHDYMSEKRLVLDILSRDPLPLTWLLPEYDSGDHPYLSDRGYATRAEHIDLALPARDGRRPVLTGKHLFPIKSKRLQ
ncbi:MAG: hypothetical protein RJA36_711 [Pseudomonadota bacterium]|jgi:hypothetical protein